LVKIAGAPVSTGVKELTHVFPTSRAILECAADDLALPKSRIGTLRSLAEAVEEGRIDFSASSDEVVRALRAVPGVGDWAAQYVALRALGEPDAFPASGAVRSDIEARAQTWRPWRGYAVIALESL
jgi:AraC family transcriptional regulator of adaptative response / DNA-3-methyladenine glycosylase II